MLKKGRERGSFTHRTNHQKLMQALIRTPLWPWSNYIIPQIHFPYT